jgi:N6-adenosine-specific RNA methylase IME4
MVHLETKNNGIFYIIEKKQGKRKHLKTLGRIPKEQAQVKLEEWKQRLEIKPIFRTVVIDPPWPMEKIQRDVRPNQVEFDYMTMSIEEIKEFPLQKFMSKDGCHVYMWTTQKFLQNSFDVFNAWGVKYQCLMTWVKNVGFTPFSWMYSTEHVLFGTVGSLPLLRKGLRLDFNAKVREHSRKPDEFYDLVTRVSVEPRVDIFSREKRDGFEQYGYEVDQTCFVSG